jgi:hypothetical protein
VSDIGIQTLWLRLQRLEQSCNVTLESFTDPTDAGKVSWRLTIRLKSGTAPPIVADGNQAVETLAAGLDQAERAGWNSLP